MRHFHFLLFLLICFLQISILGQDFDVTILVTDGPNSQSLVFGMDPNGTEGYDPGLDVFAPPAPPAGAFDARFNNLAESYLTDIRDNLFTEKQFHMAYAFSTGNGPIVLTWDDTHLDSLGIFSIVDDITGTLFGPVDMTTTNTLTVTDPLILDGLRILATPYSAHDTIHVPADFDTIQEAIDVSNNGNVVLVADGTYYENINYKGKAITVASHFLIDGDETHIENTIINGSQPSYADTGSVVIFNRGEDANSVLCGFTITGGTGTLDSYWLDVSGGGIYVASSGATIKNNIIEYNSITHNSYTNGGGICILDSDSTIIENNVIRNNTITGNEWSAGGGLVIYDFTQMGYVKVANNKVINNTTTDPNFASGGGIEVNGGGGSINEFYVISNLIEGNNCSGGETYAGGLTLYDCSPTVLNNLIVGNSADIGGGVLIDALTSSSLESKRLYNRKLSNLQNRLNVIKYNSSEKLLAPDFENNTVINNSATIEGGGVSVSNSSPQLMNFIIWGNTAPSGPQVSLYNGTVDVQYSDVEGGWTGTGNINQDPLFNMSSEFYLLTNPTSPCIDAGNPAPIYFDVGAGGNPLPPAYGTLINDMGHCGGPQSLWYYWDWPLPVELTSFTATIQHGKVNLFWTTATEVNNLGFEIERKIFKNQYQSEWITIGFREGYGTTTEPNDYSYADDVSSLQASSLAYRLKQIDFNGSYEYSDEVLVDNGVLTDYALKQNYPNPFNPVTIIRYSLSNKSEVEIVVYNALGEKIVQLVNEEKIAGSYEVEFDATKLPSGVYFYKLQAGDPSSGTGQSFIETKKMVLMK